MLAEMYLEKGNHATKQHYNIQCKNKLLTEGTTSTIQMECKKLARILENRHVTANIKTKKTILI